jgi:hypothetical protein
VLAAGSAPRLQELRLHNGTVYRWNRPVYDLVNGMPHLRVENRVLPAGPTVVDTVANALFYYGVSRVLSTEDRPVWTKMSFDAARHNFTEGARRGIQASLYWPGHGELPADELVLRKLLPIAQEGLERWGVSSAAIDRYLGIIEARCTGEVNGASWQIAAVESFEARGSDRRTALRQMLEVYCVGMNANVPVHEWDVP